MDQDAGCRKRQKMCWLVMMFLVWIGSVCVVCCMLLRPEDMWCVLALQRSRTAGFNEPCFMFFICFGNGGLG